MRGDWPDGPYYVLVARKARAPRCEVWPAHSLRPLPRVPVPLNKDDGDVEVELQPLLDAIYKRARYADDIDYRQKISVPLSAPEKQILASLAKQNFRKD